MSETWVEVPEGSPFTAANLPYGVFSRPGEPPRVGVAIGDHVLDVSTCRVPYAADLRVGSLNPFMSRGRAAWIELRERVSDLLGDPAHRSSVAGHLVPRDDVLLHLPFEVADYVDFYSSEQHATNIGRMLRPDAEPLTPNWRHLPIGYHGRSGTVVVSGTPLVRPCGLRKAPGDDQPSYGPSLRLDIEAEVGFVVGVPSALSTRVPAEALADHVFGVVLVNDWSARDIQAFEYVPLGPFLGKSFATSVSPWVVPLDALEAARVGSPRQQPAPADYLRTEQPWGLDLTIEVRLNGHLVSRPPFAGMYWTPAQQLAHLTVNGASLRTGDLFASGTVSGPTRDERGSLMELSWNGTEPLTLPDGTTRTFLEDGDTVTITATAPAVGGGRLGFGEVRGTVQPPHSS
ncbi:MAG: fumarylacetoacetase [Actinomycetota bacterium]|nr:fumarylacetoacetase [Actinomycetota bacterium]